MENLEQEEINGIPVIRTCEAAAAVICWERIEKAYIYGLDHYMVPEYLINACNDMNLKFDLVDFNYRIIEATTITHPDSKYGSLSFLENKRDIPFSIKRTYWITETERTFTADSILINGIASSCIAHTERLTSCWMTGWRKRK